MTDTSHDLTKLVLDSGALSIWDHATGPVFWGAAKVPMPFYINTELMIGKQLSTTLLERITSIVAGSSEADRRGKQLHQLILAAYEAEPVWQHIVQALIARARAAFPGGAYQAISGGERRDWLFSIPFAQEIGRKHLYLFKDGSSFCAEGVKAGEQTLHVCDLINNAASHFDMWFPMLAKINLGCAGTLAVNSRGSNGMNRLQAGNVKAITLNAIDIGFFEQLAAKGLIGKPQREEIAIFFASSKQWAETYLMGHENVFHIPTLDPKSLERMRAFFTQDPWELRAGHAAFFAAMEKALA